MATTKAGGNLGSSLGQKFENIAKINSYYVNISTRSVCDDLSGLHRQSQNVYVILLNTSCMIKLGNILRKIPSNSHLICMRIKMALSPSKMVD